VQAVVSVVFLTTLFIGILSMNTMLPVLIRERAVFYRERSSYMYAPEAHSLSYALIEIPWLIFLIFLILTGCVACSPATVACCCCAVAYACASIRLAVSTSWSASPRTRASTFSTC
jgi:hypothetical protein